MITIDSGDILEVSFENGTVHRYLVKHADNNTLCVMAYKFGKLNIPYFISFKKFFPPKVKKSWYTKKRKLTAKKTLEKHEG